MYIFVFIAEVVASERCRFAVSYLSIPTKTESWVNTKQNNCKYFMKYSGWCSIIYITEIIYGFLFQLGLDYGSPAQ